MKKIKSSIIIQYTFLFVVLCISVYGIFAIKGKSFIWQVDGFNQHFIFLQNFRNMFSNFSWNSGLGLDTIGQYSYYLLGDPFAYISLLFPLKYIKYAYNFLVILRIYCVGLSFIAYCKYHHKNKISTLIGAIVYTFSGYVIYTTVRHPYFTNAVILLPLLLLGIDRILKEDKYKFFIIISTLSAISNYYFFYMLTILAFIYAIIKYINEYKKQGAKVFFSKFFKTLLSYIVGVLIAGIILLPTVYAFLNSARTESRYTYYSLSYYAKLFFMENSTPYWSRIYVSSIILSILPIAIFRIKKDTENRSILINLLIYVIMLLMPFIGSAMNGFSFQSNRWSFAFAFLASYLVAHNFNERNFTKKEIKISLCFLIPYLIIALILYKISGIFTCISICIAILITLCFTLKEKRARLCYILVIISICLSIILFSVDLFVRRKYSKEFVSFNKIEDRYDSYNYHIPNFGKAIKYIKEKDDSFYRIGTNYYKSSNFPLIYKYNGLNSYLSIGNNFINNLSKDLLILNKVKTNPFKEYDSRTGITTLLGCKYYVVPDEGASYVPYGYKLIKQLGENDKITNIYENQNSLPIGLFYNSYINSDFYNSLSPVEKEQAILQTACIDNNEKLLDYDITNIDKINSYEQNVGYKLIDKKHIIKDNTISIKKKAKSFILEFSNIKDSELYLYIENLRTLGTNPFSIEVSYHDLNKKQYIANRITSPYYEKTPNILFNLGYKQNHSGKIKVTITTEEDYLFDNIKLLAIPMDSYETNIKNLSKTPFTVDTVGRNFIDGTINNSTDGILQISTSFSKGWSAYVDNEKTDIININTAFIGIPLKSGSHQIHFEYHTPYLNLGIICTVIGLCILIGISVKH